MTVGHPEKSDSKATKFKVSYLEGTKVMDLLLNNFIKSECGIDGYILRFLSLLLIIFSK